MSGLFDSGIGKVFKMGSAGHIANPLVSQWGRGYFDAKKKDEFPGTVRNKHVTGDLRAREAAKVGTVVSQASRYT